MDKKKIVLVEDNAVFSMILKFVLEKEGYSMFLAGDGKEAKTLIESENPDIVLLDVMLPYVNGLEVVSYVRGMLDMTMPIIVFSASGQDDMVHRVRGVGANDFIEKPFDPDSLVVRIKQFLN
ncbi:response regulator [Flavobacterium sediminis]|uniref:Response regulator n=1 Tax=Flavobacterium sediminis TaxID=2201181 RepID=A0A2U8QVK1_9FLAO|nr:response regulator [Flavobacterium sediminis]AWM14099.1 response regulator [Flavobacterium sediminis]